MQFHLLDRRNVESNEIKIIIQNNCLADQKNLDIQSDNATLTLTARYLQSLLIARSLDRSSYIFLMLQLLLIATAYEFSSKPLPSDCRLFAIAKPQKIQEET